MNMAVQHDWGEEKQWGTYALSYVEQQWYVSVNVCAVIHELVTVSHSIT